MRLKSRRGKQTMTGRIQALIPSLTRTRKGMEPSRRACQRDPSPGLLFVPGRGGSLAASQLRVKRRSADRSSVIPRRNFFFPPHLGGRKGAGGGRFESAENMATVESNQRGPPKTLTLAAHNGFRRRRRSRAHVSHALRVCPRAFKT